MDAEFGSDRPGTKDAASAATGAGRNGMSRRDLIRAAGVAGVAAWTAPVIIGSVSSAALGATGSGCGDRWYMKLVGRGTGTSQAEGTCFNAGPLCTSATGIDTGATQGGTSSCTDDGGSYQWSCATNPPQKFRSSFVDSDPGDEDSGTYTVTLAAGCFFAADQTNFTAVGNYNWTSGGGTCIAVGTTDGSNTVVFPKSNDGKVLDYMYLEFICP